MYRTIVVFLLLVISVVANAAAPETKKFVRVVREPVEVTGVCVNEGIITFYKIELNAGEEAKVVLKGPLNIWCRSRDKIDKSGHLKPSPEKIGKEEVISCENF